MNLASGAQEYVRAGMRDAEVVRTLKTEVMGVVERWLGVGTLGRYMNEIATGTEAIYLLITLLSPGPVPQTLGEEYVSVSLAEFTQVTRVKRVLGSKNYIRAAAVFFPKLAKVALYILVKVALPYAIRRISALRGISARNKQSKSWFDFFPPLDSFWEQVVDKAHFSLFLLTNLYDDFAKRLLQVVYIRHYRAQNPTGPDFSKLGYLILAHACANGVLLAIESVNAFRQDRKQSKSAGEEREESEVDASSRCPLCLSQFQQPSCPPCGHLFCWTCLISATQLKPECPQCRQPAEPRSVLQLRNLR